MYVQQPNAFDTMSKSSTVNPVFSRIGCMYVSGLGENGGQSISIDDVIVNDDLIDHNDRL